MKKNKQQLVSFLLENTEPTDNVLNDKEALICWFYNIRPTGGLRLTDSGFDKFLSLGIDHWSFTLDDIKTTLTKKTLLALDRKLQFPYYINFKGKNLIFFSSKEAMLARMYGNLEQFLAHYNP